MKKFIFLLTLLILPGCETLKNYEFGDVARRVIELKNQYCSQENADARAATLLAIHAINPGWIPVCVTPTIIENNSN